LTPRTGGIAVSPDDVLWPCPFSANRDPRVYDDPRRFDVTREPNRRPLLTFGAGRHSCLGRMIAIVEMQEVLRGLLSRWSEFEVVGANFTGAPYSLVCRELSVKFEREAAVVA
jgi:cytochrome P450